MPPAPARVLEVGCGEGTLARGLAAAGYDVMAIDPRAPEGPIFRRIKFEDLEEDERFDAVVESRAFHHMPSLDHSLERVARALSDGGLFVVDEFAWDQLDEPTAEWYEGQRRVLIAAGRDLGRPSAAEWAEHHRGLHGLQAMRSSLAARFHERYFQYVPYLWRYLGGPATAELEESLIGARAIRPLGFRFVGIPKSGRALKES